jgi:methyl-accepting chemotaxis protein
MTLRTKFIALAVGIMLTTIVLAGMSYFGSSSILFEQAERNEKEANHANAQAVAGKFASLENVLLTASNNLAFMIEDLGILPGTTGGYLRTLTEATAELGFLSISLSLSSGVFLEGQGWFPPSDYDPRDEDWYRGAMEKNGSILTGMYCDPKTGCMIVTLAVPVFSPYQEERLLGVLSGDIRIEALGNLASLAEGEGRLFLFDSAGNPLLGSVGEEGEFIPHPLPEEVLPHVGKEERFSLRDSKGEVFRGTSFFLPYGFSLIVLSSERELLLPLRRMALHQGFFLGSAIVLLCALLFSAGKSVLRPMNSLMRSAKAAAEGDLTILPSLDGRDEIALLSASFASMIHYLKDILLELRDESIRISGNAEMIDTISAKMSEAFCRILAVCQELQNKLEESGLKLSEMKKYAEDSAEEGRVASLLANECGEKARYLMDVGEKTLLTSELTVQSVSFMNSSFANMGIALKHLEEKTGSISAIVSMIEEIARKTNLLSLNASIEAARAGNRGKGFAVVAEEIRLLSRQSGEAAAQIGKLAGDILRGSSLVVSETGRGKDAASKSREDILQLRSFVESLIAVLSEMEVSIVSMAGKNAKNAALGSRILSASEIVALMAREGENAASTMKAALSGLERDVLELKEGAAELDLSARCHSERMKRYRLDDGELPPASPPAFQDVA